MEPYVRFSSVVFGQHRDGAFTLFHSLKRHVHIPHIIALEEYLFLTNAAQPCTAADD